MIQTKTPSTNQRPHFPSLRSTGVNAPSAVTSTVPLEDSCSKSTTSTIASMERRHSATTLVERACGAAYRQQQQSRALSSVPAGKHYVLNKASPPKSHHRSAMPPAGHHHTDLSTFTLRSGRYGSMCSTPNGDSIPPASSSNNSSPQHQQLQQQHRQDSDCGSSSGLGGMGNKHDDDYSTSNSTSSSVGGKSRDSGDGSSADVVELNGDCGGGGSESHRSLAATSTLTPPSSTMVLDSQNQSIAPMNAHHPAVFFPGMSAATTALPPLPPNASLTASTAVMGMTLGACGENGPILSTHSTLQPLYQLSTFHGVQPQQLGMVNGVIGTNIPPHQYPVALAPSHPIPPPSMQVKQQAGDWKPPPTSTGASLPPAVGHQPHHALYTITCEAAAMAAAAAAAAGYHVSVGSECPWPAISAAPTFATPTTPLMSESASGVVSNRNELRTNPNNSAKSDGSPPSTNNSTTIEQSGGGGGLAGDATSPPSLSSSSAAAGGSGGAANEGQRTEAITLTAAGPPTGSSPAAIASAVNSGHDLFVHIHPGESIALAVGSEIQHISGPATIRMVSQSATPHAAIPLTVPPGHLVQQILDRDGSLRHIIMSQEPPPQTVLPQPTSNGMGIAVSATPPQSTPPKHSIASTSQQQAEPSIIAPTSANILPARQGTPLRSADGGTSQKGSSSSQLHRLSPKSSDSPSLQQQQHELVGAQHATGVHMGGVHDGGDIQAHQLHNRGRWQPRGGHPPAGPGPVAALQQPRRPHLGGRNPPAALGFFPGPYNSAFSNNGPVPLGVNGEPLMPLIVGNGGGEYGGIVEEEDRERLKDMLNRMQSPTVTRVGPMEADIMWQELDTSEAAASGGPFPQIDNSEFVYELFIYDGSHCVIHDRYPATTATTFPRGAHQPSSSANNGVHVAQLRPATDYYTTVRASLPERHLLGTFSPRTSFRTQPWRPDVPAMPKLLSRQPTSVLIAWRQPLANGSPIVAYILQLSEGKTESFETVYEGMDEQSQLNNLVPGRFYRVRVLARNALGTSEPSPPLGVPPLSSVHHPHHPPQSTSPLVPSVHNTPLHQSAGKHKGMQQRIPPPNIVGVSSKSIRLSWSMLSDFPSLFMEMSDSARNIYHPISAEFYVNNSSANVTGLYSNREYRFRLVGTNQMGEPIRSDYVAARTAFQAQGGFSQQQSHPQHQTPSDGHSRPQHPSHPPQHQQESAETNVCGRIPTPTNLHKIWEDDESLELGWNNGSAIKEAPEGLMYFLEGACEQPARDSSDAQGERTASYSAWKLCYKGTTTTATIHDPHLCLFRVQCAAGNDRRVHSSWSDNLLVKRKSPAHKVAENIHVQTSSPQKSKETPRRPSQCAQPRFKSMTSNSVKIVWKSPPAQQKGKGDEEQSLLYELQRVDKQPLLLYSGSDLEYEQRGLRSMEHIQVRVKAIQLDTDGKRIEGDWSGVASACTLAAPASAPLNLRIVPAEQQHTSSLSSSTDSSPVHAVIGAKSSGENPSDFSLLLQWDVPAQLNGSPVSEYLVSATKKALCSSGSAPACELLIGSTPKNKLLVEKLSPAHHYVFHVCAMNEAGPSEKSNAVEYTTPAGVPDPPARLHAEPLPDSELKLKWSIPNANGAPIVAYRVSLFKVTCESPEGGVGNGADSNEVSADSQQLRKAALKYKKELAAEEIVKVSREGESIGTVAEDDITEPHPTSLLISSLEIDTVYEVVIQAENSIGLSGKAKIMCTTLPPPPEPPLLSLAQASATVLKLKWSSPSQPQPRAANSQEIRQQRQPEPRYYYLEKENESGTFSPVYEGELHTAKVRGLKERSMHRFRIRASISRNCMLGAWSQIYSFLTTRQPPPALRSAPSVSELEPGLFQLEWGIIRGGQPQGQGVDESSSETVPLVATGGLSPVYHYRLQVTTKSGAGKTGAELWKTVYEGPASTYTLAVEGTVVKMARVLVVEQREEDGCSVEEVADSGMDAEESTISAPSPVVTFTTMKNLSDSPKKRPKHLSSNNAIASRAGTGMTRQSSITTPAAAHAANNKVGLYRKIRKFLTWLKKTISEKDCALIVLLLFVMVAIFIAVLLNSYLSTLNTP